MSFVAYHAENTLILTESMMSSETSSLFSASWSAAERRVVLVAELCFLSSNAAKSLGKAASLKFQ